MAGSLTLKTQKSRLTRHCNNLSDLCMRCEEDISFQNLSLSSDSDVFERMASLTHELKASAKLLSEHLSAFISTVEGLNEPLNEEQEGQVLDYMEKTQSAIDRAENLVIRMEAKRLSVLDSKRESEMRNERTQVLNLVRVLHKRLENANTDKSSIQAQRKLLEFIIPVVTQLQKLGANLDGSYNTQKVLSKFAYRIQRKVLEVLMTHDMPEEAWKMQDMIEALDAHIGTEERINSMVKIDMGKESERGEGSKRRPTKPHNHSNCIFCDSTEHRAAGCSRYSTIAERRNFLQENKMCLNCGRKGHFASQCSKEGCRLCQGTKHFYALCPQRQSIDNPIKSEMKPTIVQPTQPSSKKPSVRAQLNTNTKNKRNTETSKITQAHPIRLCAAEENIQEEEGQEIKGNSYHSFMPHSTMQKENIVLLTGIAHLWNAKSQKWQPVEILFDTGADQSFISQDLTEELGLQCKEMQELNMYTFGDKKPKAISCGVTTVGLLDSNGEKHNIRLYATPVLTAKGKMTQLSQEDKNFMMHNNICLSTIIFCSPNFTSFDLWRFLSIFAEIEIESNIPECSVVWDRTQNSTGDVEERSRSGLGLVTGVVADPEDSGTHPV
ncbi:zinc knuckle [Ostertagia ostertagi]